MHEYGPGWGNAILYLPNTCSIAASLGRSVYVRYPAFEATFLPPDGADAWPVLLDKRPWLMVEVLKPGVKDDLDGFRRWFRDASQARVTYDTS